MSSLCDTQVFYLLRLIRNGGNVSQAVETKHIGKVWALDIALVLGCSVLSHSTCFQYFSIIRICGT